MSIDRQNSGNLSTGFTSEYLRNADFLIYDGAISESNTLPDSGDYSGIRTTEEYLSGYKIPDEFGFYGRVYSSRTGNPSDDLVIAEDFETAKNLLSGEEEFKL